MSSATARRYGGLCKRCGLRPKKNRMRNLILVGLVLLIAGLWWWTNTEILTAEQTGGSFVAHRLLISVYENSGRYGVNVIFCSIQLLTILFVVVSVIGGYNQNQSIRNSLSQARHSASDGG